MDYDEQISVPRVLMNIGDRILNASLVRIDSREIPAKSAFSKA